MSRPLNSSGSRLKWAREKAGLYQAELAEKTGYSVNYISALECGARAMSGRAARQFEKILSVTGDYLLCLTDFPFGQNYDSSMWQDSTSRNGFPELLLLLINNGFHFLFKCAPLVNKYDQPPELCSLAQMIDFNIGSYLCAYQDKNGGRHTGTIETVFIVVNDDEPITISVGDTTETSKNTFALPWPVFAYTAKNALDTLKTLFTSAGENWRAISQGSGSEFINATIDI